LTYKEHFYAMPIFGVHSNILLNLVHTIKTSPTVATEDGQTLKAVGISDVQFELKNGSKYIPVLLNTIYTPDMAFTLILISQLDEVDCSVNF
jgi:hypothetical protein